LGSLAAEARVKGFQGDFKSQHSMAACAKHFAAYGFAETGLEYNSTDLSPNTLKNIVLPPFKAAAKAGSLTFMNGFNDLGGTPVTASSYLQRDILKGEWEFNGFVVSDWGSIGELVKHGMAADDKQAAELALKAGSDMDMESNCYTNHLAKLIEEKKVPESTLNEAVRRILRVKFQLGLFDNPYKYCNQNAEKAILDTNKKSDLALEAARKSIVLLKNENKILPLQKQDKIALIGALAFDKDSPLGSWRARARKNSAISVEEGIKLKTNNLLSEKGVKLLNKEHSFLYEVDVNTTDFSGINEAVTLAKKVDKVVMVLGEDCFMSGEGRSRTSIGLPGLQLEMLKAVQKVNPNIVLVLMNGRPLTLEWESQNIPAIVETWHLGNESGNAIADVLYGDYNPSGKLTVSFPRNVGQCPIYYNHRSTGRPTTNEHDAGMVFYSHYTDSEKTPLFPFGYGLSYSNFKYSDLKLSNDKIKMGETIEVQISVQNTSKIDGEEIVQLYIHDIAALETRPVKELKSFQKIKLKAGEAKTLTFKLTNSDLGYYRADGFVTEAGVFKVFVGGNSRDVFEKQFELID
jgi:beta-glucosidase